METLHPPAELAGLAGPLEVGQVETVHLTPQIQRLAVAVQALPPSPEPVVEVVPVLNQCIRQICAKLFRAAGAAVRVEMPGTLVPLVTQAGQQPQLPLTMLAFLPERLTLFLSALLADKL